MSGASSRSDEVSATLAGLRATAGAVVAFGTVSDGAATRLAHLEEYGGVRVKFPHSDHGIEAVTINTGGGMLGGDHYRFDVSMYAGGEALVTSQSAERIYRALDAPTTVDVSFQVGPGATLLWVPQETILYSGAKLMRRIEADMAADSTLLVVEAIVFGRAAHGEEVRSGEFRDRWRIHRAGRLVYADAARLGGDIHAALQSTAVANGARTAATVLFIAPDAEARRDRAREALGKPHGRAAVSAWNGMLVGRFLALDSAALRRDIVALSEYLMRRPMPRVWGV